MTTPTSRTAGANAPIAAPLTPSHTRKYRVPHDIATDAHCAPQDDREDMRSANRSGSTAHGKPIQ